MFFSDWYHLTSMFWFLHPYRCIKDIIKYITSGPLSLSLQNGPSLQWVNSLVYPTVLLFSLTKRPLSMQISLQNGPSCLTKRPLDLQNGPSWQQNGPFWYSLLQNGPSWPTKRPLLLFSLTKRPLSYANMQISYSREVELLVHFPSSDYCTCKLQP